ncbi:DNA-binding transcriptional regulator, MurR/RpiR family, contains HTH and SIS domains [Thalassobacillus cyri]|uniref:DNA-binding transcriptional regulator, MurR/RpiR family, contains HTH and SIS domains n=1 Tax=Thalassobacillus cyri TaxID=571932 RepID=A0A1H4F4A4_9BACI|nr:MurR/RpiR family transcriptional regulator [Thalassobacillus cyri]SEA91598.1 DNA-binding transcriptional regulator, MurR/RpiR family, contains HTH and SIS domains [Thalassobacillus cyri]
MGKYKENILDYIISNKSRLTKKQQLLCDYVLENHKDIGLMTVKELAEKANVGKTTVLRFVQELGYDSFFELKKEFHEVQKDYSDKWENVQHSFLEVQGDNVNKTLYSVWQEVLKVMDNSLNPQLLENFETAIELLENAKTINLLGSRPYRAIAIYTEALIGEFDSRVRQLSHDGDAIIDRVLQFDEDDVLVIFTFSPYSQRDIDAAELAYQQNASIILITDYLSCPITSKANVVLKLESSDRYYTLVPMLGLVEAMVIELGRRQSGNSVRRIKKLVNTLREKNYITD